MKLIEKSLPESVVVEYKTIWFKFGDGQLIELERMTNDSEYGIGVWYNENKNGKWRSMVYVPFDWYSGHSVPILDEPLDADTAQTAIRLAHRAAQTNLVTPPIK